MPLPLVLLPGAFCDARLFGPQLAALAADRAVTVAPLTGSTVEAMAEALAEQLPPRFALAGHSLGGMVAIELLERWPDRVARLCLMDTSAQPESPGLAAAREPRIIAARTGRFEQALADELKLSDLAEGPGRAKVQERRLQMARALGPERFVEHLRALQRRPDGQAVLRRARVPALVLCGVADPVTPPRRHEFIATLMRQARFERIEGAGHLPSLEQPGAVTAALRGWLAE